jgi:hypothetical protein
VSDRATRIVSDLNTTYLSAEALADIERLGVTLEEGAPLTVCDYDACLPKRHSLARKRVRCDRCDSLVHLPSNSCLRTWVESGRGNFCLRCFVFAVGGAKPDPRSEMAGVDCLAQSFGIKSQP